MKKEKRPSKWKKKEGESVGNVSKPEGGKGGRETQGTIQRERAPSSPQEGNG